jgi:hypothetical protein
LPDHHDIGNAMTRLHKALIAAAVLPLLSCATVRNQEIVRTLPPGTVINSDAAWASLDLDASGSLSLDELERQRAMGLLQDFPNADADGDGNVSRQEWDAWWPRMTHHHIRDDTSVAMGTAQATP